MSRRRLRPHRLPPRERRERAKEVGVEHEGARLGVPRVGLGEGAERVHVLRRGRQLDEGGHRAARETVDARARDGRALEEVEGARGFRS